MKSRLALILVAGISAGVQPALAEPPPGHPGALQAIDALGVPPPTHPELPHAGVVLSAADANSFTYLEVRDEETGRQRWLAVPRQAFRPGDRVRYDEGGLMTNFFSRKLNTTFESILFVRRIVVVTE